MLFKESKKRECSDPNAKTSAVRKPAWTDEGVAKIKVDINDISRLRKLKSKEGEAVIKGDEFSKRLKLHHNNIVSNSDLFSWA
jgi:U3 small nucleolar RNA-associated protein 18